MSNFEHIQDELRTKQLNIDKIFKLGEPDKQIILKMFDDLVDSFYGERGMSLPGGLKIDYLRACVLFNTLSDNEYLITRREKNLDSVLEN